MQISPVNLASISNKKNNPNFKGNLSYPLAGELSDFVQSHSNVHSAVGMFADALEFETSPTLQVLLRELPEEKENPLNNARLMYIDSSAEILGAKEFFLDKAKSAQEIYVALEKTLRDAIPKSFIR